jgi:glutamate synthase domain-containing protein 3
VARRLLSGWPVAVSRFRKVMPLDYRRVLAVMKQAQTEGLDEDATLARVMEAAHG